MTGIFLLSVSLRFWDLSKFNTLVFDEVYYAKFANNYLTGTRFFNAHPPLGNYIIAIGIWIASHLRETPDTVNDLTGSLRSTFSYRWLNALTGSFIPLVVGALAYQLNPRRSYALIAAVLAATDGLFLVESRYALTNIYLVIFGLLGQLYFLLALRAQTEQRWQKLTLSGLFFGASAAVKWNGLGFLWGIYLVWPVAWGIYSVQAVPLHLSPSLVNSQSFPKTRQNLTPFHWLHIIWYLGIVPLATYSLSWIPHLLMNPQSGFWQMQREILTFHQRIGSSPELHPYCSRWYSWIFMWRPVAYFYQTTPLQIEETVSAAPSSSTRAGQVIYDVHGMGNPALWWLSTVAILLLLLLLLLRFSRVGMGKLTLTLDPWIGFYLVLNYGANLLPWIMVSRCTFIYHYMGASVFAQLGLALIIDRWLNSHQSLGQIKAITVILAIIGCFLVFLPIYLGLPLSYEGYRLRMWFPNWI